MADTTPSNDLNATRAMIDTFLLLLVQALALRATLVAKKILTDAEIEAYCQKIRESPAMQRAAESFVELNLQALLSSLKIDGPPQ